MQMKSKNFQVIVDLEMRKIHLELTSFSAKCFEGLQVVSQTKI